MYKARVMGFVAALASCAAPPPAPPAPVITNVSPQKVDTGGGDCLTISGANFAGPGARVLVGALDALEVDVRSATEIRFVTPAVPTTGAVDVVVINGGAAALTSLPCPGCVEYVDVKRTNVTEFYPLENSVVPKTTLATVKFNEAVDPTTVDERSFFIDGVAGATFCDAACTLGCGGAAQVKAICFKPAQPLAPSTHYTGRIVGTITDLKGNPLIDGKACPGAPPPEPQPSLSWHFLTCEDDPPGVTSREPAPDAVVATPARVRVTFDEGVESATVSAGFAVYPAGSSTPVPGSVQCGPSCDEECTSGQTTEACFLPSTPFAGGHAYDVVLRNTVADQCGNALESGELRWTFTTAS